MLIKIIQLPRLILFVLAFTIFAEVGCTKKTEDQPPSNREDQPSAGRNDRADRRDDGGNGQQASGPPRAPKGEVKRDEYTVQVGLFDRPEDADQLAYELRAQRVNNFVQPVGKQWRVCVGRYYSEGRASRMADQLKAMGFAEAKVVAPGN